MRLEIAEPTKVRPVSGVWASPLDSPRSPDGGSKRFFRFGPFGSPAGTVPRNRNRHGCVVVSEILPASTQPVVCVVVSYI